MRHSSIAAALFIATLAVSSVARAEDPGADEVTLKNGGSIRNLKACDFLDPKYKFALARIFSASLSSIMH
jgi:hypothetical protein